MGNFTQNWLDQKWVKNWTENHEDEFVTTGPPSLLVGGQFSNTIAHGQPDSGRID
jgi:hypothetical protein